MSENEPATAPTTERLSCTTCRKRKLGCNRVRPCSNCVKAGFECTFPSGRRRPREGRHQLALRLQNLESHLQDLAKSLNPQPAPAPIVYPLSSLDEKGSTISHNQLGSRSASEDVGKLDIDADRSRYSSNALWATLGQEIAEMQDLLQSEDVIEVYDKDLSASPSELSSQDRTPENLAWLFSTQKASPSQQDEATNILEKPILWTAYTENVAPLIKIFHFPTMKKLWQEVSSGIRILTAVEETAFGSIYLAAAVSLSDSETRQVFNKHKNQLVQMLRIALEQSFQEVELLNTGSVMILQAFILYIITLRRLDDTRLVLSMIGIAVRLAISVGLQRDGSKFKVDFFEVEVRRRIWWQLALLDFEVSNDHGVDPLLRHDASDTALPSNINDEDVYPGMAQAPTAKPGFTEMTPSLVRFEISATARKLLYTGPDDQKMTLTQQRAAIEELQARLQDMYLKYCSNEDPIQWSTTLVARSKITALWVSMYHQLQQGSVAPSQDLGDKMMTAVIEIVDDVRNLESNPRTVHMGWYFHNDVQWPAIVYLLNAIIRRPPDALSERAWDVLKRARDQWHENAGSKVRLQGMLFKPMRALTNRAFWVKEGKQPPSRMSMSKITESFPEFSIPNDFAFDSTQDSTQYFGDLDFSALATFPDLRDVRAQQDLSTFEAGFGTVPERMDDFMQPLWNQNWQFLAQDPPS